MRKSLKFATEVSFLNLIAEPAASNVVLALIVHQQSHIYVSSITRECISFNDSFRSLIFFHVRRETKHKKIALLSSIFAHSCQIAECKLTHADVIST
jgi:hypothetical protein